MFYYPRISETVSTEKIFIKPGVGAVLRTE